MKTKFTLLFLLSFSALCLSQNAIQNPIPKVYSNIHYDADGNLYFQFDSTRIYEQVKRPAYTLGDMIGTLQGTDKAMTFDFHNPDLQGTLYYGFIPYGDSKHPSPVYLYKHSKIENGKTKIKIIKRFSGVYDMVGWEKSGYGTLGYRIVNDTGLILYDGKVTFEGTGPFKVGVTIIEGPFINLLTDDGATISFTTNVAASAKIRIDHRVIESPAHGTRHDVKIAGLAADTKYTYSVVCGLQTQTYSFKTAPKPGSRKPFVFAYSSDSRSGQGGGERNLNGTNAYIMKKIMALNAYRDVAFCQFTGDLVTGYLTDARELNLQYANWKRAVEPFWHYFPVYVGMGNHEVLIHKFSDKKMDIKCRIDRFPFDGSSAEDVFSENFVNPQNGLRSEDGAYYDPDKNKQDFPSYGETVYYYTYDNVAVIVLNSDYFYTPDTELIPRVGGNAHGYIMDNQLKWFRETVKQLEKDKTIDHVFVTLHTPFFPNGGHVGNDMWYDGNNEIRAFVAGKPLKRGIIERRDELLDIIVNKSKKIAAILTGDEHNYNRLRLDANTDIYPENYSGKRIKLSRVIYQINNGAAGAPFYAQEQTPWSPQVSGFTTQNAVVLFHVHGKKIDVEVQNPDTLEEVDRFTLR